MAIYSVFSSILAHSALELAEAEGPLLTSESEVQLIDIQRSRIYI